MNKVCQFIQSPLDEHWKAVKRILRYLAGTLTHGLIFTKSTSMQLTGFCDADWGSDIDHRRSVLGFCVFLGRNLVSWSSKKQQVVARSSTEAEYHSLASVIAEILWHRSILTELRVHIAAKPFIFCDNLSTVLLSKNLALHQRPKHFELDLCFVREKVVSGFLNIVHVPSLN